MIELMVTLMLMALLTTLIVPAVASAMRRTGIDDTGRKLSDLIKFSSSYAVTRHRMVMLNLDSAGGRCWVTAYGGTLPWRETEDGQSSPPKSLASLELPKGTTLSVDCSAESNYSVSGGMPWDIVTFRANGGAEDVVIRLSNSSGETLDIEVFGVTGELRTQYEAGRGL
ncbi:MAG: hypothetical protein HZB26_11495 [Candidatus Hydrogenedentes bacterium]|nr:hypothetical protein [Candidatus Hydrogenedentota bacterium]